MRPTPTLLSHTVSALAEAMRMHGAADQAVSRHFREHRALGQQERAFIAETVFAVLRRRRSLAAIAGSESPRALVLAALIRIHGFSVRAVADVVRDKERDLLEHMRAVDLSVLPMAVQQDLPDWLWDRLIAERGEAAALAMARSMLDAAPMDVRVNTFKAERSAVLEELHTRGIEAILTPYAPDGIRLQEKPAINRDPAYLDGRIEVQDEGSQLLAHIVAARRGEMVVDFCAGAGGKTLALGAMMRNSGRLYAFDVSAKRLSGLDPRLARSGLSNVHPIALSTENDLRAKRLSGKIDRVLVDAPCSGFGTLRRNPDLKWRFSAADVTALAEKQARILAAASRLPKVGGRLVFATCSVLREEGEDVAEKFLETHPSYRALSCADILLAQRIPLETGAYLRLDPQTHGCDGFFAAAFERIA